MAASGVVVLPVASDRRGFWWTLVSLLDNHLVL